MAETKTHKEYMRKYRTRRAQAESANPSSEIPWRTRRHATTRNNGEPTTHHLMDTRQRLILASETDPLSEEEAAEKLGIEDILRTRGELAPVACSARPDLSIFYRTLYTRLGLTKYLTKVETELSSNHRLSVS